MDKTQAKFRYSKEEYISLRCEAIQKCINTNLNDTQVEIDYYETYGDTLSNQFHKYLEFNWEDHVDIESIKPILDRGIELTETESLHAAQKTSQLILATSFLCNDEWLDEQKNGEILPFIRKHEKKYPSLCRAVIGSGLSIAALAQFIGLMLGDSSWRGNGEIFYRDGTVDFLELPAFREDITQMVKLHQNLSICPDNDFPRKVMAGARYGDYATSGMDRKTEDYLFALGLPDWFIEYVKKVHYLPTRERAIDELFKQIGQFRYFGKTADANWVESWVHHGQKMYI